MGRGGQRKIDIIANDFVAQCEAQKASMTMRIENYRNFMQLGQLACREGGRAVSE